MSPAIVGVFIPVIAIVLGVGAAIVQIIANHRQRLQRAEHRHRERLAALDKGLELPADPVEPVVDPRHRPRDLLRGLVLLLVGAVLVPALMRNGDADVALFGLLPAAVGLAYVIYYVVERRRESAKQKEAPGSETGASLPPLPPRA
jgi:hypothetical protein